MANAGVQDLHALLRAIAADLKVIVTHSTARVISSLPVFVQSAAASKPKENANSDNLPAI